MKHVIMHALKWNIPYNKIFIFKYKKNESNRSKIINYMIKIEIL